MRAALHYFTLLLGVGVGAVLAEEADQTADDSSPIFVRRVPVAVAPRSAGAPGQATPVGRQLAELIRRDAAVVRTATPPSEKPRVEAEDVLQLEKMTVEGKRVREPPVRETAFEKFVRTGYLWEFSKTKRLMIGPRGDKVGLMFSFDW